ncbi:uncharacterized protein NEMAJ01_1881 [Nematocida major]|uniref:uncharacterized protein n=1 Tax=Nematocida major TaxID=1912982 RepID=UPI002008A843|nr:uncharacterized protein NEMAJ01_1881 [Nematocida major]KAH9386985.1 hypothetical protein NEMAJ01_1881 [Nematocida major]
MKNCRNFAQTGHCPRGENCPDPHRRDTVIEKEMCSLCCKSAQCVTVCRHFFCYECARGFIEQSTKCIICSEETNGVVFITVKEACVPETHS